MEIPIKQIKEFIKPLYANKDIMHDLTHIERVKFTLDDLAVNSKLKFNHDIATIALYLHGIIYTHKEEIKSFLKSLNISKERLQLIIKIAWESQKDSTPTTNEGKILHDAHMLEGGRNFEIIKSLITGSVRGQSLEETMTYIENNLLNKGHCYTKEGKMRYQLMTTRTKEIFQELDVGLGRKAKLVIG